MPDKCKLYFLALVLTCAIPTTKALAQMPAVKCGPTDDDCAKAELESAKAGQKEARLFLTPAKPEEVRAAPNSTFESAKSFKTNSAYPAKLTFHSPESHQQQSPGDEAQELAKKLSNPVASLISLPFQGNFDFGMGPGGDGFKFTLNIQPVIPVDLSKNWNLISRTIVPVVYQRKVVGTSSEFGLSDTVQTFFISPKKTKPFIWGLGPQFLIPTGTNNNIRSQKFGLGPSLLLLQQTGGWTYGILATQMWSVAGKQTRADVNSTFLQPFIAYATKTGWTYTINTEATYDWTGETWSVPIHIQATKLVKIGKQRVSVGGGLRCWAATTPTGPVGCGIRLVFTPLFPKK